jgi:peptidyl-prolyl cis-trans isomerase B (cyclophilin B)
VGEDVFKMKITKNISKVVFAAALTLVMLFNLLGCSTNRFYKDNEISKSIPVITAKISFYYMEYAAFLTTNTAGVASIEMEFELDYANAPITVTNFVNLVNSGYYDGNSGVSGVASGTVVHRLENSNPDFFLLQMGGYMINPNNTGAIVPLPALDYTIKGEFAENGWSKDMLSHLSGVLSMARTSESDSANSQFFLTIGDCSSTLDGTYASFGMTTKLSSHFINSMKDYKIESRTFTDVEGTFSTFPQTYMITASVSVDTHGFVFPQALRIPKK